MLIPTMTRHPRTAAKAGASAGTRQRPLQGLRDMAVVALLAHFCCGAPAQAANPVKIAVAGPSSGPHAATATAIARGARDAIGRLDEERRAHAMPSTPQEVYDITLKDDGCDAAQAVTLAKEIVAEGFDLVLGHPCPKAALAASAIYGPAGVTFIATETRHPDLTGKHAAPSIFRLSGRDDAQGLDAARILARDFKDKKIAVVHDRTLYAKTTAEHAVAGLKALKIEAITATIVAGDKEYAKLAAKIKGADVLFFAGFPLEAGFIVSALRAAGSSAVVLASDAVATPEFTSSFPQTAKDVTVLQPLHDAAPNAQVARANAAVRFYALARARAAGPASDAASLRALFSSALFRLRLSASAPDLAGPGTTDTETTPASGDAKERMFDAAGNANIPSYGLVRWTGKRWTPVPSMR